jgi:hypothetical protein
LPNNGQSSDEEIQDIVITGNLTPRKCRGFKRPIRKELGKDVQESGGQKVRPFDIWLSA